MKEQKKPNISVMVAASSRMAAIHLTSICDMSVWGITISKLAAHMAHSSA